MSAISAFRIRGLLAALTAAAAADPVSAQYGCDVFIEAVDAEIARVVGETREALELDLDARYRLIDQYVKQHFDFEYGMSVILHGYWESAPPALQQRAAEALYNYLRGAYGHLVIDYEPDTLELDGDCERASRRGRFIYGQPAVLTLNDGDEIDFSFIMHELGGRFVIIDVRWSSNSQIASLRDQFLVQLEQDGIEPFVEWLEKEAELSRERQLGELTSGAGGGSAGRLEFER